MCTTIEQQPCKRVLMPTIGRDGRSCKHRSIPHGPEGPAHAKACTDGRQSANEQRSSVPLQRSASAPPLALLQRPRMVAYARTPDAAPCRAVRRALSMHVHQPLVQRSPGLPVGPSVRTDGLCLVQIERPSSRPAGILIPPGSARGKCCVGKEGQNCRNAAVGTSSYKLLGAMGCGASSNVGAVAGPSKVSHSGAGRAAHVPGSSSDSGGVESYAKMVSTSTDGSGSGMVQGMSGVAGSSPGGSAAPSQAWEVVALCLFCHVLPCSVVASPPAPHPQHLEPHY